MRAGKGKVTVITQANIYDKWSRWCSEKEPNSSLAKDLLCGLGVAEHFSLSDYQWIGIRKLASSIKLAKQRFVEGWEKGGWNAEQLWQRLIDRDANKSRLRALYALTAVYIAEILINILSTKKNTKCWVNELRTRRILFLWHPFKRFKTWKIKTYWKLTTPITLANDFWSNCSRSCLI